MHIARYLMGRSKKSPAGADKLIGIRRTFFCVRVTVLHGIDFTQKRETRRYGDSVNFKRRKYAFHRICVPVFYPAVKRIAPLFTPDSFLRKEPGLSF